MLMSTLGSFAPYVSASLVTPRPERNIPSPHHYKPRSLTLCDFFREHEEVPSTSKALRA